MFRFRFKNIRTRLLAIVSLAIAGAVALLAVGWRWSIEPALRTAVTKNQWEVAKRAADQIDDFIEKRIGELQTTVEVARFWEMRAEQQKEAMYRLLKFSPTIHELSLVDQDGREHLRLSRTKIYTEDDFRSLAEDEQFLSAMKGEIYISGVYHGVTAEPYITLSVPVKFTAREIRGAVVAEISLRTLWQSIAHIRVGKTGYGYVVDQKGNLIAHPDYSKVLRGTNLAHLAEIEEFLRSPDSDVTFGEIAIGEGGKKAISTFALVPRTRWGVIVEEPVDTALAEVNQVERFAVVLFLLILAGAFGLSYWFSERITRPIRVLEQGAKLLSSGNLDYRLEIRTGDEVESLATQFNIMASALKESYRGLEEKVSERTKEISALAHEQAALSSVAMAAGRSLRVEEVLQITLNKILEVTGRDVGFIRVKEESTGRLRLVAQQGLSEAYAAVLENGEQVGRMATEVLATGKSQTVNDPSPGVLLEDTWREGIRAAAWAPIQTRGQVVGVLTVASKTVRAFETREVALLEAIGSIVGAAVNNAQVYEEMAKLAADLSRSNRVKDEFLSVMSHELRTPLNVVMGYTGMVKDRLLGEINPEQEKALEKIMNRAREQLTMITGILTATQMEADKVKADISEFYLPGFLDDLRSGYQVPSGKEIALRWDYAPDLPVVRTDEEKLRQILQNLIDNAIKFTSEGSVSISARLSGGNGQQAAADGQVEFTVTDTGIGIPEEYFPFIFERFRQVDSSETRHYGGVGMGLYIVKKLTELLGGKVEVESEPGKGSVFTVTVPCQG